jgi:hypothetical protein
MKSIIKRSIEQNSNLTGVSVAENIIVGFFALRRTVIEQVFAVHRQLGTADRKNDHLTRKLMKYLLNQLMNVVAKASAPAYLTKMNKYCLCIQYLLYGLDATVKK